MAHEIMLPENNTDKILVWVRNDQTGEWSVVDSNADKKKLVGTVMYLIDNRVTYKVQHPKGEAR